MSAGKIALIVVAVIVLAIAGAAGAGYLWLQKNSARLQEEAKAAMRDGARLGSGKPAQVCLDESLRRLTPDTGLFDEALNKTFFTACLKVAEITPELCAGIPPRDEIVKTAMWAVAKCGELGRTDQACTRLVGALQHACLSKAQGEP